MYEELPWEQPFLAALAKSGLIKRAAKAAGVGTTTVYTRRRKEPEFDRRVTQALPSKEERQALIDLTKRPGPDSPGAQWRAVFLQALAESSNVRASAALANVTTARVYKARREEAAFAIKWRAALREGYDNLEIEVLGHLRDPQPERKMDVAAAARLLAAHRATVERERALESEEDEQAVLDSIDAFLEGMRQRRLANEALLNEAKPADVAE
ncbi:MAG: hypothetical protein J2O44_01635 [Porphyrobacter sp.]|nr:hypothetical protein [Porphyrobacter sp.]